MKSLKKMSKLIINLDYKRKAEAIKDMPNSALTADYIGYASNAKYPNGLDGKVRRIYGRIQCKLDDALDKKADSIELEAAEVDFLKSIFKEDTKFPTNLSQYVVVLEDAIDALELE